MSSDLEKNNNEGQTGQPIVAETGKKGEVKFDPEKCKVILGKGQKKEPRPGEIVLDTGDHEIPADSENPWKATIESGVIDHHRIDHLRKVQGKEFKPECSAQIVVDYPEDVLAMIKKREATTTFTHGDGDLDSIVSSYLTQSLIQNQELPAGAKKLAEHVNRVDYGMYRESDPEKYLQSLSGVFSALQAEIGKARGGELGREVFGNPSMKDSTTGRLKKEGIDRLNAINSKWEQFLTNRMFQILNGIQEESKSNPEFDPEKDMGKVESALPGETRALITNGKESVRKEAEVFNEDFEQAKEIKVKVKVPGTDTYIEVPMLIVSEPRSAPLVFTNLAYQRVSPETIVAVYGGENHKRNKKDMYDVGIKPESASLVDMGELCVALNKAEKEKRDQLPANDETFKRLEAEPDRLGMSGQKPEEQVLKKDPTVLVAGGTLIAASRESLLRSEDFERVMRSIAIQGNAKKEESGISSPESKLYDEKNNTLRLTIPKGSVDLSGLKKTAEAAGFDEKDEFHITVLGFKNGAEVKKVLKKLSPEQQTSKLAEIQSLVEGTDWKFATEPKIYRIAKEYKTPDPKNKGAEVVEKRESFIQTVDMPGMKEFYAKLNAILGTNLEAPPSHITLYTNGSDKEKAKIGIGINSQKELDDMKPELVSTSSGK